MDDRSFMEYFIRIDGTLLAYASERLKNDKDFVLIACNQCHEALLYSNYYRNDPKFVLPFIIKNSSAAAYISPELKNNVEFMKNAILNDDYPLIFSSRKVRESLLNF